MKSILVKIKQIRKGSTLLSDLQMDNRIFQKSKLALGKNSFDRRYDELYRHEFRPRTFQQKSLVASSFQLLNT